VEAVREPSHRARREERDHLARVKDVEARAREKRDHRRITPALGIVVRDIHRAPEEIARGGAVLPVEVRLDGVVADRVIAEDLARPVECVESN
jgi:hypothetical protein